MAGKRTQLVVDSIQSMLRDLPAKDRRLVCEELFLGAREEEKHTPSNVISLDVAWKAGVHLMGDEISKLINEEFWKLGEANDKFIAASNALIEGMPNNEEEEEGATVEWDEAKQFLEDTVYRCEEVSRHLGEMMECLNTSLILMLVGDRMYVKEERPTE